MLLRDFLNDYYAIDTAIRESTLSSYQTTVSLIESWAGHPVTLGEFNDQFINRWIIDYSKRTINGEPISSYSVKSRRGTLLSILNAANECGLMEYRPGRIRKVKCHQTEKDVWTPEQAIELIRQAGECRGRCRTTCIQRKWFFQGIFAVAWDSGLRIADIIKIRSDVIKQSREFSVVMSKTLRSKRVVLNESTHRICLMSFDRYCDNREFVFPSWRSGTLKNQLRAISTYAKGIMEAAGLDCTDGIFKKLRRSSITHAESLQPGTGWVHAGHSGPDITIAHYINQNEAYRDRAVPKPIV